MHIPIRQYFALLYRYLRPQAFQVFMLSLCIFLSLPLQLLNPKILQYFIDTALAQGTTASLVYTGFLFIAIALFSQGLTIATSYLGANIAWTATNLLRNDLLQHCLSLDMSFHKAHTPGEMIERIDGDVDSLSNFFSSFVLSLLNNMLLLLGILIIFYWINWIAGVAITVFSFSIFLFLIFMRRRIVRRWTLERQISAMFYGFLAERLGGTEDIRANGATSYTLRRFFLLLREWFPIRKNAVLLTAFTTSFTLFMFIAGSAISLGIGMYLWSIKVVTIGTVVAMFTYADLLSQPIQQIQVQSQDLQQAEACIKRTEELLAMSSVLTDGTQTIAAKEKKDQSITVEFVEVSFGYIPEEMILKQLSFSLQPGRVLGILGRTGSGKTTIARLLFRLYDPQQGEILINNIPIRNLQLHNLRRTIGMVTQDVQLFRSTLRDNLTLFRRDIADEKVISALKEVGLAPWYISLPNGLDTLLGPDGEGLSSGEAQLLAFARVLLSNPGLIILDEASSRLDPATEGIIEQSINTLCKGRTSIVIAHRLATIQRVDDILIIEDGRVVEHGPRRLLANDPSSRLVSLLRAGLEDIKVDA